MRVQPPWLGAGSTFMRTLNHEQVAVGWLQGRDWNLRTEPQAGHPRIVLSFQLINTCAEDAWVRPASALPCGRKPR